MQVNSRGIAPVLHHEPRKAKRREAAYRCDADLVRKARELRNRWMDQVNAYGIENVDPASPLLGHAKYDVTRVLETGPFAPDPWRLAA